MLYPLYLQFFLRLASFKMKQIKVMVAYLNVALKYIRCAAVFCFVCKIRLKPFH